VTTVEPADRAGLHWQPLAATEREALFDACERFLAGAAAAARARPDVPAKHTDCPICGHRLGHQYRQWRGAVLYCPRCRWEGPPR
jgi:NADH pyrophosphatase NudC (nudix superfamily)